MLRRICAQGALSPSSLDAGYGLRRREVRAAVGRLGASAGGEVEVGTQMFVTVLNVITSMLWGDALGAGDGEDRGRVGREFRELMGEMSLLVGSPNVSDLPGSRQVRPARDGEEDGADGGALGSSVQLRHRAEEEDEDDEEEGRREGLVGSHVEAGGGGRRRQGLFHHGTRKGPPHGHICRRDRNDFKHNGVGHGRNATEPGDCEAGSTRTRPSCGEGRRSRRVSPSQIALPRGRRQGNAPPPPRRTILIPTVRPRRAPSAATPSRKGAACS
ncbi:putative cytochrome P450 76M5-like [Iris pallida]|uniref:Cytochrome P450 76M5-like n=1 Tax=Iris pallida TaxID=29817 RepID=A0AAX6H4D1_IRIPA|nr:putative cytochrome P450 76M5-like [Iris pallida]